MIKLRFYFDKDDEEKWLNEMCSNGWAMTKFFAGFYWFDPCEKGKYIYQIDFRKNFFHIDNNYREFMQDMGIEVLQPWGFWVFLRKPATDENFKLYTDIDSCIEHYTRIRMMFKVVCIIEILCFFIEFFAGLSGVSIGYVFSILLLAFIIPLANIIAKITNIIMNLKEQKGEINEKKMRQPVSMFLPFGLLLNSCTLLLKQEAMLPLPLIITSQIAAIALILIGIFRTSQKRNRKNC